MKYFLRALVVVIATIGLPGWIVVGAWHGVSSSLKEFVSRFKTVWSEIDG